MSLPAGVTPANTNPMPTASAAPTVPAEPVAPTAPVVPGTEPVVPVVAPAAAPVPDPTAVPTPTATPDPGTKPVGEPTGEPTPKFEYTKTGNEFMDSAAEVAMDAGLDPMQLAATIRDGGDISATDRAVLTAKIGEAHTNMLVKGFKSEIESSQSAAQASIQSVHEAVGGEDMWKAIQAWSATEEAGLTPEGEKAYNEMLQAGGVQAQLAANALKEKYMSSPGFKEAHPTMQSGTDTVPAQSPVKAISRTEYTAELKKANREGNAVLVAELDARARHTMQNNPDLWRPQRLG